MKSILKNWKFGLLSDNSKNQAKTWISNSCSEFVNTRKILAAKGFQYFISRSVLMKQVVLKMKRISKVLKKEPGIHQKHVINTCCYVSKLLWKWCNCKNKYYETVSADNIFWLAPLSVISPILTRGKSKGYMN